MKKPRIVVFCADKKERKGQNVAPNARGWASMRMRILFCLIFLLAVWGGSASAENASGDLLTYRGVPLLSLNDGSRFIPVRTPGDAPIGSDPGPMLKPLFSHLGGPPGIFPTRIYFLRLLFVVVLMSVLTLPLIAVQRMRADLQRHGVIRIFPIFKVVRGDGHREPFRMAMQGKEA
jgi:hypothetical protein